LTTRKRIALRLERWAGLLALLACTALGAELQLDDGSLIRYELVASSSADSATGTAQRLLSLLSEGKIDDAAALSNAPQRRRQVLSDYRDAVGEAEFRRVFAQYGSAPNRLVAELAIEKHHLLVWDLTDANHRLAGQFYVRAADGFLLDDAPSEERSRLQRLLAAYRQGRIKP
jgi:hypothetical protein